MRRRQKKTRKVKGGACGSCMMPPVQSGGRCPCAASKLPITFGGVRRNRNRTRKNNKRVRFA